MGSPPPSDPQELNIIALPHYIWSCIKNNMTQKETVDFLAATYNIDPAKTLEVWEMMEQESVKFFRAHIDDQLPPSEKLLELRMTMMCRSDSKPLVQRYVEFCMECVMTKHQAVNFLATNCNIDRATSVAEWNRLKQENSQLYRKYCMNMDFKNLMDKLAAPQNEAAAASSSNSNRAAGSSSHPNNDGQTPFKP